MEYIWDRIPKQKDGKTIRYLKADLDYLYYNGFVDSRRFDVKEWKKTFLPFYDGDGGFVLDREQFLSLRKFRYTGPSDEVFDAMKIKEGPWSDKGLEELYQRSIGVASDLSNETFWAFINSLKKSGRVDENGNLIMDHPIKLGLQELIEQFPSPRRRLEQEVERLKKEDQAKSEIHMKERDKSAFTVGKTAKESTLSQFKALESSSAEAPQQNPDEPKEEIDLKSLRKPSKTFRG